MIWRQHIHKVVFRPPDSWSNWNLEMLVLAETGKPEYPQKNLLEQGREPTTNSSHRWRRRRDLNPGHIGGRRALSPRRHPLLPKNSASSVFLTFDVNVFDKFCPIVILSHSSSDRICNISLCVTVVLLCFLLDPHVDG